MKEWQIGLIIIGIVFISACGGTSEVIINGCCTYVDANDQKQCLDANNTFCNTQRNATLYSYTQCSQVATCATTTTLAPTTTTLAPPTTTVAPTTTTLLDTLPPVINFVSPTDFNGVSVTRNFAYINATVFDAQNSISACRLEWNGVNETMGKNATNSKNVHCYVNKTLLSNANYTYRVFANDTRGNSAVSPTRNIVISSPLATTTTILATTTTTLAKPDLQAWGLKIIPNQTAYLQGSNVTINATVSNFGNANAPLFITYATFDAPLLNGGKFIGFANTGPLAISVSEVVRFNWTLNSTFTVGNHSVYVCADSAGQVAESNEINNCAATNITIA